MKTRILAMVVCGLGAPALACDYCSTQVTLNGVLAKCYLDRVEQEIDQMQQANLPAQLINLASCDGAQSATRGTTVLPTVRSPDKTPDLSFLMDEAGLRCLALEVSSKEIAPESVETFKVRRDC